jgi:cytochrome P450
MVRYDQLPGPSSYSVPDAFRLATRPVHEVLEGWSDKYGDRVHTRFVGRTRLFLNEPPLLGQILEAEHERFYKIEPVPEMRPMVRQSVFISNGAEWGPKRRAHPFESSWLDPWMATVLPGARGLFEERLGRVTGSRIEMVAMTRRLSFDVFCLGVFGRVLGAEMYHAFNSMYDDASLRMKLAVVAQPLTVNPLAPVLRDAWFTRLEALVHGRSEAPEPSLLAWLARHGTTLDESLLVDEVSTILFAGVGPVAVTMASLLYELGRRPEVLGGLREQASRATSIEDLSAGAIAKTVAETLRVWPTVSVLSRARLVAGMIGDIEIDADVDIFMSPWALHRSPRVWSDPLVFSPERFAAEPAPWTYLPFGIGPRTCVGEPWALFLLRLFTATLARGWDVEVPSDAKYGLKYYSGFARPTHRLHGAIRRRS